MPVPKKQLEYAKKHLEKLDEIKVRVPLGKKDEYKEIAATSGKSLNGFIVDAIEEKIERMEEKKFDKWVKSLFHKKEIADFRYEDHIKECIDNALADDKMYEYITYKGNAYDFNTIDKSNLTFRIDYAIGGFSIVILDDQANEMAHINTHLRYEKVSSNKMGVPYLAHIHRLGTREAYRMRGYAKFLVCVVLLVADQLGVEQITVHNTCEYKELYSMFGYHSKQIIEWT